MPIPNVALPGQALPADRPARHPRPDRRTRRRGLRRRPAAASPARDGAPAETVIGPGLPAYRGRASGRALPARRQAQRGRRRLAAPCRRRGRDPRGRPCRLGARPACRWCPRRRCPRATPTAARVWVTRARPKIDRIACPWLIRRFVDPDAVFLFVAPGEVPAVAERFGATPFDIEGDGVFWSHRGELCTFDVMVEEFGLAALPALTRLARIVRGADTARPDLAPEAAGLLAVSLGLSRMYRDDLAQLEAGMLALRRPLPLVPRRHRRDPQLAGRAAERASRRDVGGGGARADARHPFRRRGRGLGARRGAELRRAGRADRGDAPHRGRREALGRRPAVPARAQLLHAAAGARGASAGDLSRLAAARGPRRAGRRRALRAAGLRGDAGAQRRLRRLRADRAASPASSSA